MPNLDDCHEQVVSALRKAGWNLEAKSYRITLDDFMIYPDIRAWQSNGTAQQIIIVEIKCFANEDKDQDELYRAIGQYLIYRNVLKLKQNPARLYLSIPLTVYNRLFALNAIALTIQEGQIRLLVVDIDREEIVQWKD